MPNPKKEIDMDALNAITRRVLSFTPPPKKGKNKKRGEEEWRCRPQKKGKSVIPKPREL